MADDMNLHPQDRLPLTDEEIDELQATELPERSALSLLVTHVAAPSAIVDSAAAHVAGTQTGGSQASDVVADVTGEPTEG